MSLLKRGHQAISRQKTRENAQGHLKCLPSHISDPVVWKDGRTDGHLTITSAKLVYLGNGILVIPFFDIGKWLFVVTLKSHLNNVLRVMFTVHDRRIMRENCYCPHPKKCVYFSSIPQGNLELGYGLAYSLTKVPKLKQVVWYLPKNDQSLCLAECNKRRT